jgi:WXG100 family type VII secretion target
MANINVTFQELTDASGRLRTGQENITASLNELKVFIDGLVGGGFVTDQASVAFQEQYTKFTTGATQTVAGLEGLSSFLTQASVALGEADASLATAIRG